jgi:hypothetical protein
MSTDYPVDKFFQAFQ